MNFGLDFVPLPHAATATEIFDDGEFVSAVFDERTTKVHRLNPTASAVWVACDGRSSLHNIVAVLAEVFDLGPSVAAHRVDEALEVFWAAGLLATSQLPPEAFSPEDAPTNVLERLHDP